MIKRREDVQEFNYEQLLAILEGQEKMIAQTSKRLRAETQTKLPDATICKSLTNELAKSLQGFEAVIEEIETRPEYRPRLI